MASADGVIAMVCVCASACDAARALTPSDARAMSVRETRDARDGRAECESGFMAARYEIAWVILSRSCHVCMKFDLSLRNHHATFTN